MKEFQQRSSIEQLFSTVASLAIKETDMFKENNPQTLLEFIFNNLILRTIYLCLFDVHCIVLQVLCTFDHKTQRFLHDVYNGKNTTYAYYK